MMIDPMKRGCENQTCQFGYEEHTRICSSSIMQSKWGGGGVSQKLTFAHTGGGGVWRGAKSAHAILDQPLNPTLSGPPAIMMQGGEGGKKWLGPHNPLRPLRESILMGCPYILLNHHMDYQNIWYNAPSFFYIIVL